MNMWFDYWWRCNSCGEYVAPYQDHYHELLQVTVEKDGSVTLIVGERPSFISRCKRFLQRRFLRNVIADHRD